LFVVGTDKYQEIETWKNFRRLFELAHLVIVNRPGYPFREDVAPSKTITQGEAAELSENKGVFYLPFVEQPISSTEIRQDRKQGADVRRWVPASVWSYIERNKLYS
jgi:nicotinate-nucleotide adenylyltransferase